MRIKPVFTVFLALAIIFSFIECNPITMKNQFPETGYIKINQPDQTQLNYEYTFKDSTFTLTPYIIDITPTEIVLGWNKNPEPDLLKYNVYFNSVKIGSTTQNEYTYNHKDVLPGVYLITVTALDKSGNESDHSEPAHFEKQ